MKIYHLAIIDRKTGTVRQIFNNNHLILLPKDSIKAGIELLVDRILENKCNYGIITTCVGKCYYDIRDINNIGIICISDKIYSNELLMKFISYIRYNSNSSISKLIEFGQSETNIKSLSYINTKDIPNVYFNCCHLLRKDETPDKLIQNCINISRSGKIMFKKFNYFKLFD